MTLPYPGDERWRSRPLHRRLAGSALVSVKGTLVAEASPAAKPLPSLSYRKDDLVTMSDDQSGALGPAQLGRAVDSASRVDYIGRTDRQKRSGPVAVVGHYRLVAVWTMLTTTSTTAATSTNTTTR